ncbi:hypothetical protein NPIL_472841 [Nephila pilipes]|uniref:Uncharacterized protein n=1 Tax=Nephila pilipes TaxID=299642 RepID=A0A8X6USA9_NEPPI|nr:hypothetical protein NPIL_472841 [Nephila pilipes]
MFSAPAPPPDPAHSSAARDTARLPLRGNLLHLRIIPGPPISSGTRLARRRLLLRLKPALFRTPASCQRRPLRLRHQLLARNPQVRHLLTSTGSYRRLLPAPAPLWCFVGEWYGHWVLSITSTGTAIHRMAPAPTL